LAPASPDSANSALKKGRLNNTGVPIVPEYVQAIIPFPEAVHFSVNDRKSSAEIYGWSQTATMIAHNRGSMTSASAIPAGHSRGRIGRTRGTELLSGVVLN